MMKKTKIVQILESCLLACDGVDEETMVVQHEINRKLAQIGIKLYHYLRELKSEA